ncbi:MAG: hypothetical protein LBL45_03415 [Treponema sp.]|nr:hypothetical protein [Treponema sp.]
MAHGMHGFFPLCHRSFSFWHYGIADQHMTTAIGGGFLSLNKSNQPERGVFLLALIMLVGYERRRDADARSHVYNFLNDGSWDIDALKTNLMESLEAVPCVALDAILNECEIPFTW